LKELTDGLSLTLVGSLFHSLGAATANARSPKSVTCAGTTRSHGSQAVSIR